MYNMLLCSQHPAQILWLDHAFRRANHSCRITTEWGVLLGVMEHTYVDAVLLDATIGEVECRCRELRAVTGVPLIIIGSSVDEDQRLLAAGADDVVAAGAPFSELLERTERKVRRSHTLEIG